MGIPWKGTVEKNNAKSYFYLTTFKEIIYSGCTREAIHIHQEFKYLQKLCAYHPTF